MDGREQTLKSPLKWAGGKRWIIPFIQLFWKDNTRWVEPFCGGLSVAFGLLPQKALLNDINAHTIHFFEHLQKGLIVEIPFLNQKEVYYRYRARFNALIRLEQSQSVEAASLFYYLNRTGYNGLCRFNRKGFFNVPFGQHKSIRYHYNFLNYRPFLKPWVLQHTDFTDLKIQKQDFIYADPPYDVPFTQYSPHGFSWNDQVRLVEWLCAHKGPVLVSNQATERIIELYQKNGFCLWKLTAPRSISCSGNRQPAMEILAFKGIKPYKTKGPIFLE